MRTALRDRACSPRDEMSPAPGGERLGERFAAMRRPPADAVAHVLRREHAARARAYASCSLIDSPSRAWAEPGRRGESFPPERVPPASPIAPRGLRLADRAAEARPGQSLSKTENPRATGGRAHRMPRAAILPRWTEKTLAAAPMTWFAIERESLRCSPRHGDARSA